MVEANLKIIEELKSFLVIISGAPEIKELLTSAKGDYTRNRKLPIERIVGLILNMPKRSLCIEIQEFFEVLEKGAQACTKGALSQQRAKLQPLFFRVWNKWLVDNFYDQYGSKVKRWQGFRLQAVDGSSAYLMNKTEVIKYFGTQDNQYTSIPMARVMQVHDVLNDITVWGDIRPIKESEQSIIAGRISNLYEDSLTLFDRGFPSFALMFLMLNEETSRHFVMRCKTGFNKEVKQFMLSAKCSKTVEFKATTDAVRTLREYGYIIREQTTIKVRMVKVKLPSGIIEILLTSLYDEKRYPIEDLKYLYGLRWGIETTYAKQKNQQQMEQFSGHRVICIQQDYASGIFVANLQSLIEKQCEPYLQKLNTNRKYSYRINRNVSWASLKHNIIRIFLQNEPEEILSQLQKAFERNVEPVRPGRQYQRIIKNRRSKGKYQTLTNYKRAI